MFKSIKRRLFETLKAYDQKEFRRKAHTLTSYISPGSRVLDVGCGTGRFAKFLEEEWRCTVSGVDVIDYHVTDIPFHLYDGKTLPMADQSFDVATCLSVLHHTDDPSHLLKELHRVAKKIVLIEDHCETPWGKMGLYVNDYFTNILQNIYKCWCGYHPWAVFGMQWRLRFKTEAELRKIFQEEGMKLVSFYRTLQSWKGMKHGVYILE